MKDRNLAPYVAVMLILATATLSATQRRHKWWLSEEVKAELQLTEVQSERLEEIFQTTRPKLSALMQELNQEEEILSDLIRARDTDDHQVIRQLDKVEDRRSALSRTRVLMLYHMYRELSFEQREALHTWRQQHRERKEPPSSCR